MTRLQVTVSGFTFAFRPSIVLWSSAAAIAALAMLFAYVGALHDAVQQGEVLRAFQRAGHVVRAHAAVTAARAR